MWSLPSFLLACPKLFVFLPKLYLFQQVLAFHFLLLVGSGHSCLSFASFELLELLHLLEFLKELYLFLWVEAIDYISSLSSSSRCFQRSPLHSCQTSTATHSTLGYDASIAHILPSTSASPPICTSTKWLTSSPRCLSTPEMNSLLMNNTIIKDLQDENTFTMMTTLKHFHHDHSKDLPLNDHSYSSPLFLTLHLVQNLLPLLRKLVKHSTSIIRRKATFSL